MLVLSQLSHIELTFYVGVICSGIYFGQMIWKTFYKSNEKDNIKSTVECWLSEYASQLPINVDKDNNKRIFVIYNPISGSGKGKYISQIFESISQKFGWKTTIQATEYRGHAFEIASKLTPDTYDLCVCIGGDGMLSEIVNGSLLPESLISSTSKYLNVPVSILPLGTGNGVATSLGVSTWQKGLNAITSSNITAVDVLNVSSKERNTHAVLSVSWGLIADVDYICETSLRWMGNLRTLLVAFSLIIRHKSYAGRIEFIPSKDEESAVLDKKYPKIEKRNDDIWRIIEDDSFSFVSVVNLPWLASDVFIAPNCSISDGTMTLILMRNVSRWSLINMFLKAETGQHIFHPQIELIKCSSVRIIPTNLYDNGNIVADGELLNYAPTQINCLPKRLQFVAER